MGVSEVERAADEYDAAQGRGEQGLAETDY
jgi:hypothetical protein